MNIDQFLNSFVVSKKELSSTPIEFVVMAGTCKKVNLVVNEKILLESLDNFTTIVMKYCNDKLIINNVQFNVNIEEFRIRVIGTNGANAVIKYSSSNKLKKYYYDGQNYVEPKEHTLENIYANVYGFEKSENIGSMNIKTQMAWLSARPRLIYHLTHVFGFDKQDTRIHINKMLWIHGYKDIITPQKKQNDIGVKKYILFQHNVYVKNRFKLINSRTHFLEKILNKNNEGLIISEPYKEKYIYNGPNNMNSSELYEYRKNVKYVGEIPFELEQETIDLEKKFSNLFGAPILLQHMLSDYIIATGLEIEYYEKLLENTQLKKIILVAAYNRIPMMYVAKNKGITVVEYQYSALMKYHHGYTHYSDFDKLLKPNEFLTWGNLWNRDYGINGVDVRSIGFQNYSKEKKITNVKNDDILFIGQGRVSQIIIDNIKVALKKYPNSKVYLKLHRTEEEDYKERYSEILNLKNPNFKIITNFGLTFKETLSYASHIVGCFSSAIYEAVDENKRIYIIKDHLYFMLSDLYEKFDNVILIEDTLELSNKEFNITNKYFERINMQDDLIKELELM